MERKNSISTRCASCDGKGLPETLRPYCSVVCRILGAAGLSWLMNPSRIVDIESGAYVSIGPDFDLTAKGIAEMQNYADRLREKTRMGIAA